jgi:UDP-glucose 4-epimerase
MHFAAYAYVGESNPLKYYDPYGYTKLVVERTLRDAEVAHTGSDTYRFVTLMLPARILMER